jgi:type IV pilus assembly protein PilV
MTRALRRTPHRAALVASRTTRLPAAGFTLVEVIVAIVLLGVGLMGLAALSTTVTRANVQSSSLTTATALAQERAERLRTQDYDAVVSGGDTRMVDNVAYTRSWTVTTDDPAPGLKTVAIAVSWTTRGVTHTTRLSTIRGRR